MMFTERLVPSPDLCVLQIFLYIALYQPCIPFEFVNKKKIKKKVCSTASSSTQGRVELSWRVSKSLQQSTSRVYFRAHSLLGLSKHFLLPITSSGPLGKSIGKGLKQELSCLCKGHSVCCLDLDTIDSQ